MLEARALDFGYRNTPIGRGFALTVAADVMELGHLGQAGEKRAAVRFQDPGASLEFEQGEASEGA